MPAYYNEIEPYAAQWLRNLIAAGHIAAGDVDERSITDVRPDDLRGYEQCHFFAGIAGWSLALRLAGWPDDRPVWTGSCPCQPFSAAGKQRGSEDDRHLWPAWFRLIRECAPAVVFGEQVAGSAGLAWLDHVLCDLEGAGYAAAAAVVPAGAVGAPHRRERLWFVADAYKGERGRLADGERRERTGPPAEWQQGNGVAKPCGNDGRMADADSAGSLFGQRDSEPQQSEQPASQRNDADGCGEVRGLGDAERAGLEGHRPDQAEGGWHGAVRPVAAASPWSDLVWLPCADGKARPTQPGLQPLAHGVSGRVGRLRAYGNAIVSQVAAEFIGAVMECIP